LALAVGATIDLLRDIVNTDSNTRDKEGVNAVVSRIQEFLNTSQVATHIAKNRQAGDHLHAGLCAEDVPIRPVLLLGHCDTVFPKGEAAMRPFRIEGGRAYGPGVADMKGGLVINAFVLAALRAHFPSGLPVQALFTSDEEIGSPVSAAAIERASRKAAVVFNAEPGRPSGAVTVARKGGVFMHLDVKGRAAHSGSHFTEGISAVRVLVIKIMELCALTDLDLGVTINVGIIRGGLTLNTVAPSAVAEFELRYVDRIHRDRSMRHIQEIVSKEHVAGSTADLTIIGEFLPLIQTDMAKAVYAAYDSSAAALGVHFGQEFSGGCSDAGIPSKFGVPTLCGVGPVGGGAHTTDEYIELDTLISRAQTLAVTILRLTEGHQQPHDARRTTRSPKLDVWSRRLVERIEPETFGL